MKNILIHIFLIMLFLSTPIIASPDFDGSFRMFGVTMFQREMLQTILLVLFFYANYYFLIPKIYNQKRYLLFVFSILLCFLGIAYLPFLLIKDNLLDGLPKPFPGNKPPPQFGIGEYWITFFRTIPKILFIFFGSFFLHKSNEQKELEKSKAKLELLNLKYQLQPHFLFNILNGIYSLSLMESKSTPESILKLSNVMRFVIQNGEKDFILLKDELNYLKDYIALQLIRTDDSLQFSYQERGDINEQKIAPLLLVNFIENAFKYGYNAEKESEISIEFLIEKESMVFKIFNKKVVESISEAESTAIGLINTQKRLHEQYPNHVLKIEDKKEHFSVYLKLNLE